MIKSVAVQVLSTPPLWTLLHRRAQRQRPATVLCYHTLGPDTGGINGWTVLRQADFRRQLDILRDTYDIVSLDEILESPRRSDKPLAVLTFDDGDRGLYQYLLPILKETPVPVTIYVATQQFETGQPFWFDRVVSALQQAGPVTVPALGSWQLPGGQDRHHWEVLRHILARLKSAAPSDRDRLADAVVAQGRAPEGGHLGPMSLSALKTMADTPGVTIGAHSHGHELLDQIPLEEARQSLRTSRRLLQEWTGQGVDHFAFPNGNYTTDLKNLVRDEGFTSAAILENPAGNTDLDPFALARISIGRYDASNRVKLRLAGL